MTICAISGLQLEYIPPIAKNIVVCPYGNLYFKIKAIEALIRRKNGQDELGSHIRGRKDLYAARFQVSKGTSVPSCPMIGIELNGTTPAILLVTSKADEEDTPNVISERALKEMGKEAVEAEYGIIEKQIRLAPNSMLLEEIKSKLEQERSQDKKKKTKKRKQAPNDSQKKQKAGKRTGAVQEARERVASAVASSQALSSLFTNGQKAVSSSEHNANLFAR